MDRLAGSIYLGFFKYFPSIYNDNDHFICSKKCCGTIKSYRQLRVIYSSFHSQSSKGNFRSLPVEIRSIPVILNSIKVFLIAILPLMYIWSLLFDHSSTAVAYSSLANTLLAMGTFVAVLVMRQIERSEPEVELEDRKSWLMGNIFTIFPQVDFKNCLAKKNSHNLILKKFLEIFLKSTKFNFAFGMFEIYVNSNLKKTCGIDNSTRAICESQNLTYTEECFSVTISGISRMTSSRHHHDVIITSLVKSRHKT